ncbi:hypothetical protein NL50_04425 [Clostridium acetobutylicum]|nr:hypothetical protein NL50_04425 [Clostridium acetobutylicum]
MEQNQSVKSSSELRRMSREQLKGKWGAAVLLIFVFGIVSIAFAIPYIGPTVIRLLIGGALTLGFKSCFVRIARRENFEIENLFSGFKNFGSALVLQLLMAIFQFLWALIAIIPFIIILISIGISISDAAYDPSVGVKLILAYVLLIVLLIPAIIAGFRYSMAYYILNDNPDMGAYEAIVESKKMMKGNKWRLFWLRLTFIGWNLLSGVPLICSFIYFITVVNDSDRLPIAVVLIILSYIVILVASLFLLPYIETSKANFYENLRQLKENKLGVEE